MAEIKSAFEKRAQWKIVCDISLKKDFYMKEDCLNFTPMSLRKGYFRYSVFSKIYNIPYSLMSELIKEIFQFNLVLEDKSGSEFTNEQRTIFFQENLRFFYNLLKNLKPDIIIFWDLPHTSENFILYKLGKKLGIKILIKHDIKLLKRSFFSNDLLVSKIPKLDKKEKIGQEQNDIVEDLKKFHLPKHIKNYVSKVKNLELKHFFNFKESEIAIRKNNKIKSYFSNFGYQIFRIFIMFKNYQTYSIYRSLCKKNLEVDKKTVTFFSNFQPEGVSNIWAPIFTNQEIALQMLSDGLPTGWKIVYKEYPKSLVHPTGRIYYTRHKEYFERLSKIKNLYFIDDRFKNEDLINNSGAVATVNGTVGWESLNHNKKILIFGDIWYKNCPGVSTIESSDQCFGILKDLENNSEEVGPNEQKVTSFRNELINNTYNEFVDKFDYQNKLSEKKVMSILDKLIFTMNYYEKKNS